MKSLKSRHTLNLRFQKIFTWFRTVENGGKKMLKAIRAISTKTMPNGNWLDWAPCETKHSLKDLILRHYRWSLCSAKMNVMCFYFFLFFFFGNRHTKCIATKDWLYRVHKYTQQSQRKLNQNTSMGAYIRPFNYSHLLKYTRNHN